MLDGVLEDELEGEYWKKGFLKVLGRDVYRVDKGLAKPDLLHFEILHREFQLLFQRNDVLFIMGNGEAKEPREFHQVALGQFGILPDKGLQRRKRIKQKMGMKLIL